MTDYCSTVHQRMIYRKHIYHGVTDANLILYIKMTSLSIARDTSAPPRYPKGFFMQSVFVDLFAIRTIAIDDVKVGGHEVNHPIIRNSRPS